MLTRRLFVIDTGERLGERDEGLCHEQGLKADSRAPVTYYVNLLRHYSVPNNESRQRWRLHRGR
jgi:hypothetical protein